MDRYLHNCMRTSGAEYGLDLAAKQMRLLQESCFKKIASLEKFRLSYTTYSRLRRARAFVKASRLTHMLPNSKWVIELKVISQDPKAQEHNTAAWACSFATRKKN